MTDAGQDAPRRPAGRAWVRWAAVGLTVAALLFEMHSWFAWKVSRDVIQALVDGLGQPATLQPAPAPSDAR